MPDKKIPTYTDAHPKKAYSFLVRKLTEEMHVNK